ncbi:hypothetical protein J132_03076 [Termitomyces sp. J132]|nr:hypothetical protein J132_03076 [Termitomyces sp. J132]
MLSCSYDASHLDFKNWGDIVWTPMSIRSFWDFLLEIKASGSAGAVGLSFHASRNVPSISQSNHTVSSVVPGHQRSMVVSNATSQPESIKPNVPLRALFLNLDYIKIYHEGLHAMHLRNMLHLWSYTEPQLSRKIRILKGATLALMDERSTGILLS